MALEVLARQPDGLVIGAMRNVGPYENNIFFISDAATSETYLVDGGYEPAQIADGARGLSVRSILVTHGHLDHHEHVGELKKLVKAKVAIGLDDAAQLSVEPDELLVDGQSLQFGSHALQAIHTPGHTPGSTCFLVAGHLFTGDTLFPGGPGNTDHDPVRFDRIISSIRERLFTLPDETVVHPGHGRDTTIGAERGQLDAWIARSW
jgi:glyoxylase-like metal-dependent hydrolase (beta-lactamase superfamily II)